MTGPDPNWAESVPSDLVLPDGHQTPGTTELYGDAGEVLRMPEDSAWPLVLAVAIAVLFVGLIVKSNADGDRRRGRLRDRACRLASRGSGGGGGVTVAEVERTPAIPVNRAARPCGWWGVVGLIATEMTLFVLAIAAYFYLRTQSRTGWPPAPLHDPEILKPLAANLLLVRHAAFRSSRPHGRSMPGRVGRSPGLARARDDPRSRVRRVPGAADPSIAPQLLAARQRLRLDLLLARGHPPGARGGRCARSRLAA